MLLLLLSKPPEVIVVHVSKERDAVELASLFDLPHHDLFLLKVDIGSERLKELLIVFSIAVFLHQELLLESDDVATHLDEH